MKNALSSQDQQLLREQNIINQHEVAYKVGDLYIAENILSGNKRTIEVVGLLTETGSRRILKG
jgi:hypothetical protein